MNANSRAQYNTPITLERDCPAVLIPAGESITLMAGAVVFVTQALGDSITVNMTRQRYYATVKLTQL